MSGVRGGAIDNGLTALIFLAVNLPFFVVFCVLVPKHGLEISYSTHFSTSDHEYSFWGWARTFGAIDTSGGVPNILSNLTIVASSPELPSSEIRYFGNATSESNETNASIRALGSSTRVVFSEVENVALTGLCAVSDFYTIYHTRPLCQIVPDAKGMFQFPNNYLGEYESVIGICHSSTNVFGHWMYDIFPYLSLLPLQLLRNSRISVPAILPFMNDSLEAIKADPSMLIENMERSFLFAKRLYIVNPQPCNDIKIPFLHRLRSLFARAYGLDKEEPSVFALYNRKSGYRTFINFDEIVSEVRGVFHNHNWEILSDFKSLKDSARCYNTVKVLLTIHGSNLGNVLFMQRSTALCEVQGELASIVYHFFTQTAGVNHFIVRDPRISHFYDTTTPFSVPAAVKLVEAAFSCLRIE